MSGAVTLAAGESNLTLDFGYDNNIVNITDPFVCSVGISGEVTGGTAPYTTTVVLTPTDASAGLPTYTFNVTLDSSNRYTLPITGSDTTSQYYVQPGSYTNTFSVVDANGLTSQDSYVLTVSTTCEELSETGASTTWIVPAIGVTVASLAVVSHFTARRKYTKYSLCG